MHERGESAGKWVQERRGPEEEAETGAREMKTARRRNNGRMEGGRDD